MNVLLYGATGMVGQGVLRECLRDAQVKQIVTIGRRPTGMTHEKVREIVQDDVTDLNALTSDFAGIDACFFCLGASALGMSEEQYSRVTYDLTLSVAQQLIQANPVMTFIYVSGQGTDSSEEGRMMWARVKGRTENALLRLGFGGAYMFRPGLILPMDDIRSATWWYNAAYAVIKPLYPLLRRLSPKMMTTTQQMGRAMISVAREGFATPVLEMRDITRF
jgi:uncharacterized protein YbjT (DUF2867 family)